MGQVKAGDTVSVHYKGTLPEGGVFDSSYERDPLEFTLGQNMVIPGVESAVLAMEEGQVKTVTIPPAEAYGERRAEMEVTVGREKLPKDVTPQVGMILEVKSQNGASVHATIAKLTADQVTLDGNHPLVGQALTFEIKLLKIT